MSWLRALKAWFVDLLMLESEDCWACGRDLQNEGGGDLCPECEERIAHP